MSGSRGRGFLACTSRGSSARSAHRPAGVLPPMWFGVMLAMTDRGRTGTAATGSAEKRQMDPRCRALNHQLKTIVWIAYHLVNRVQFGVHIWDFEHLRDQLGGVPREPWEGRYVEESLRERETRERRKTNSAGWLAGETWSGGSAGGTTDSQ